MREESRERDGEGEPNLDYGGGRERAVGGRIGGRSSPDSRLTHKLAVAVAGGVRARARACVT